MPNSIISITTKIDLPSCKSGTKLEKLEPNEELKDFYNDEHEFWQIPNKEGIKTGATLKEILASPEIFEIEYGKVE